MDEWTEVSLIISILACVLCAFLFHHFTTIYNVQIDLTGRLIIRVIQLEEMELAVVAAATEAIFEALPDEEESWEDDGGATLPEVRVEGEEE